jgi:hypothetical protein
MKQTIDDLRSAKNDLFSSTKYNNSKSPFKPDYSSRNTNIDKKLYPAQFQSGMSDEKNNYHKNKYSANSTELKKLISTGSVKTNKVYNLYQNKNISNFELAKKLSNKK